MARTKNNQGTAKQFNMIDQIHEMGEQIKWMEKIIQVQDKTIALKEEAITLLKEKIEILENLPVTGTPERSSNPKT